VIRFSLLGSGSSGNAVLCVSENAKVLIDSGLSFKELNRRVALLGQSLEGLDAVFITHEHFDHVQCLGTLARRLQVPVYLTEATHAALPQGIGALPEVRPFESGDSILVRDMLVSSFDIPHDAVDPVSYTISCAGAKLGIATDLGHASTVVRNRLEGANALVIESNYCPDLLRQSVYPAQIQQRIRGRHGHLSNQDMASLLHELRHEGLKTVVLVHVSENNNTEDRARAMAENALRGHGARLHVAPHHEPTPLFEVTA